MARKVIIDTDPGIDDAVAIAIATNAIELDIELITTVAGNVGIEHVTNNTLKLLKFLGKKIPVAKGAYGPLLKSGMSVESVHGKTGMEGYEFPEPDNSLLKRESALEAMHNVIQNNEEITLVCIGPLTNIALLIRTYPKDLEKIKDIVIMGGAIGRGNSGVYSEYNFHFDPEAAKIVIEAPVKKVICPLEIGKEALIFPEISEQIKQLNGTGEMFYALFKRYRGGSFSTGLKMYDSTAVAYLLAPEIYTLSNEYVAIETKGELTQGASIIDINKKMGKEENAVVAVSVDADAFRKWFVAAVEKC